MKFMKQTLSVLLSALLVLSVFAAAPVTTCAATADTAVGDEPAPTYTVTVLSDNNGTASASISAAVAGETIRLFAVPNNGYCLKQWEVVSGTVTVKNDKFVMPAENVTVRAIFEASAYTFATPTTFELTPFSEWTTLQFDMSYLNFSQVGGSRTPERIRLVLGNNDVTALTKQGDPSKKLSFYLSNARNTQVLRSQRMLDWNAANTLQNMYLYISSSAWNNAEPGTYEVDLPYYFMWYYSTNPRWSSNFGYGFIYITVTVTERHIVTVTATRRRAAP